jgi:hypothetical protein
MYRFLEFMIKTTMFPIIFFSIAELTFANKYGRISIADLTTYNASIAFSVLFILGYLSLVVGMGFYQGLSQFTRI